MKFHAIVILFLVLLSGCSQVDSAKKYMQLEKKVQTLQGQIKHLNKTIVETEDKLASARAETEDKLASARAETEDKLASARAETEELKKQNADLEKMVGERIKKFWSMYQ